MAEDSSDTVTIPRSAYAHLLEIAADGGPADTIESFYLSEKISAAFFYKMKLEGWGPAIVYYGSRARILPAAKRKWREERAAAATASIRRGTPEAA
jgi:hypothetical protein